MLIENCVIGLPVKILSKSAGCSRVDYKTTVIEKVKFSKEDEKIVIVDKRGNYFLPEDLEPLWGDTQND